MAAGCCLRIDSPGKIWNRNVERLPSGSSEAGGAARMQAWKATSLVAPQRASMVYVCNWFVARVEFWIANLEDAELYYATGAFYSLGARHASYYALCTCIGGSCDRTTRVPLN